MNWWGWEFHPTHLIYTCILARERRQFMITNNFQYVCFIAFLYVKDASSRQQTTSRTLAFRPFSR